LFHFLSPPERQGFALGIYGAGNIGQSLAAYGSPVLAAAAGFKWGFWTFGVLLSVWLVIFASMARNAPGRGPAICAGMCGHCSRA
jgi:MFS transporter, NNP family, nitrate/nitrite transporter